MSLALPFPNLSLPPLPLSFPFPLPSLPLEAGPPKIQLGSLGSVVSSPRGVWGGTPAKIKFGAF